MPTPIPENVKATLDELTAPQKVVIRAYIATLREEIKGLEEVIAAKGDPDPHAHYHGHDKCTADHGHAGEHGAEEESHGDEEHKLEHKHEHKEHKAHDHGHEHKEHNAHDHGHEHREHKEHDHGHEHEGHGCEHAHDHAVEEDIPAWKKVALDSDPMAAPFGGDWNTERSVCASEPAKMEE